MMFDRYLSTGKMKTTIGVINILAAIFAFIASLYWFKASRSDLPRIDKETGKPSAPVSMLAMANDIVSAAELNSTAALWSCAAALCGGVSLLLSTIFLEA